MSILKPAYQGKNELALWGAYPPMPQTVKLLDGTVVKVRLIQPGDTLRDS